MKYIKLKNLIITFSCLGILTLGIANLSDPFDGSNQKIVDESNYVISENSSGKTYGSNLAIENQSMDSNGNPNDIDLILVEATNGKIGYVTKEDFYDTENQPNNPEEAIEYMKALKKRGDKVIPVYDEECKEIIGEYTISTN